MGMSASQARYLSLTARKSDLEYRGQQINQSRLMLSNQSANLYSSMLSMSVPTPPVETDYMKDVYTFSMNGDTVTLTSSKLSMGRDGYNYDIIYSRPESKNILASSATSDVQRSITRSASKTGETVEASYFKVATTYDDSAAVSKTPNVSKMVKINNTSPSYVAGSGTSTSTSTSDINSDNIHHASVDNSDATIGDEDGYYSIYNMINGKKASEANKPDKNSSAMSSGSVGKMTKNEDNNITYNYGTDDTRTLQSLDASQVAKIFGGTATTGDNATFDYSTSLLSNILDDMGGTDTTVNIGYNYGKSVTGTSGASEGNVAFYIDIDNMNFYVMKCRDGKNNAGSAEDSQSVFDGNGNINYDKVSMYEYNLADLLGLELAENVKNSEDNKQNVYYQDYGSGSSANREYYVFGLDPNNNNLYFQTVNDVYENGWTIEGNKLVEIGSENIESEFGIVAGENQNANDDENDPGKDKLEYQYFRDTTTGDIWELCTRTPVKGAISETWYLYEAQKEVTYDNQEAQLIDESEWPSGIINKEQKGDYECYYVPDETGTGGSYYMVQVGTFYYDQSNQEILGKGNSIRQYDANNTYNIDGNVACVVSSDKVPSTILDAYDKDSYIVYATYDDSDTDFSDPIKYYVFPKDDESADAVCSYAYEKSYTGKNELVQARANILVDENGRFSKIDIKGEGTFALEYGQEKDEEAYNEAYRDYEYRLQKYEKEMQDIDAQTALIQEQDKKLELQLKSIDTEHSAIQTELEALKKVIDQNIQSSFGTFGG